MTAVEFAFVAPVMFLLLFGLLELGYVGFARSTLESSILVASRQSKVAQCPAQNADLIRAELAERMSVVASADGNPPVLTVASYGTNFGNVGNPEPFNDVNGDGVFNDGEAYTDINGNGQWDADMGKTGNFGAFGEVVEFTASYNVPSLIPYMAKALNNTDGFYTITAETVVRNEPFKEVTCP
ncbi:pilus assembly protein [Erythrobacter sp. NFXS35]|uniref:TadE/TadG family type IV pilus assembly protein n=1 Tax=Erythrobacter sp. NFXS35 TaxID=2818436 RepID=UPI0032DEA282